MFTNYSAEQLAHFSTMIVTFLSFFGSNITSDEFSTTIRVIGGIYILIVQAIAAVRRFRRGDITRFGARK